MKHNINPITNQYFSCIQIAIATYASYQKRDYEMMFAESWGFGYHKDDYPFGASLNPGHQNRIGLLLEKFHGIQDKYVPYSDKKSLLQLFESILPNSPVILCCDVFNCPWNISYKRNHINHSIIITGIDKTTKNLYVLDPYITKDENIIDIDRIAPDNGYINYFITLPINKHQVNDYQLEIINTLNHINNSGFFQNFKNFYNDFQIRFEEVIFSEYLDEYAIPLIINLRHIANQRYCYCIFLNIMINKKLIDSSMVNMMKSIAEKYCFLRMSLIKQIMKKKSNKEGADIINEIMNNEYEAYEKMKSFI
jgi:hypothetical protein